MRGLLLARWRALPHSLGVPLFLGLFAAVGLAFAAYAVVNQRATSRQWQEAVRANALGWSELIQQATRQGMLANRQDEVHAILRAVADTPGVTGVRFYNKQGVILFSADRREIGRRVDLQAEACVVCHRGQPPLAFVPTGERARVFRGPGGERLLGLINPIENAPACAGAGCHAPPTEQEILGVLDVRMSLAEADRRLAAAGRRSNAAGATLVLVVGATSALFIFLFVRRPIRALIAGTERVARGELGEALPVAARDEIGRLAEAFNRMTRELALAQQENSVWARTLEQKVAQAIEERARAEHQALHVEKLASLGTLAATVAHELNNPLAGILNYAKLVERRLAAAPGPGEPDPAEQEELRGFLGVIQQEAGRCGKIVRNFLLFARRSGGELAPHALDPLIEQALAVLRHHLEMNRVNLLWEPLAATTPEAGELVCDAGQIQQALLDLLVNAVEAMPDGGTLTVSAHGVSDPAADTDTEAVEITVADTGVGIPPDALPHLYEPFFTTKEKGGGSGLGLSVVYGIVVGHGGTIAVESRVGRGTTFRLRLPRRGPATEETP
jgi:two-component system NtrC family sensor kinase